MIELLPSQIPLTNDEPLEVENEFQQEIDLIKNATFVPSNDVIAYSLKQIISSSKKETPLSEI